MLSNSSWKAFYFRPLRLRTLHIHRLYISPERYIPRFNGCLLSGRIAQYPLNCLALSPKRPIGDRRYQKVYLVRHMQKRVSFHVSLAHCHIVL